MSTKLLPLLDADCIMYRVGFAASDSEPIENVLHSVKVIVHSIWDKFGQEGKVYLSGKDNYRDRVATIRPYKGNRIGTPKPFWYKEIKEYLIYNHGAIVVDGMEADDAVGIDQYANKDRSTVIVSPDKDLKCIPGWHFNPIKEGADVEYITLQEANLNFWRQVITGDTSDNIQGIPKAGIKKAEAILKDIESFSDMQCAVLKAYEDKFKEGAYNYMHENATLIWIQREKGKNYDGSLLEEYENRIEEIEGTHPSSSIQS